MSNIKKYIIDYDWKASIEIEIDHDVMTEENFTRLIISGQTLNTDSINTVLY